MNINTKYCPFVSIPVTPLRDPLGTLLCPGHFFDLKGVLDVSDEEGFSSYDSFFCLANSQNFCLSHCALAFNVLEIRILHIFFIWTPTFKPVIFEYILTQLLWLPSASSQLLLVGMTSVLFSECGMLPFCGHRHCLSAFKSPKCHLQLLFNMASLLGNLLSGSWVGLSV